MADDNHTLPTPPMNDGYGYPTNPFTQTLRTEIYFYNNVLLDPTEQNWYVPSPPGNLGPTSKISDWWSRDQFEAEVLTPNLNQKLSLYAGNPLFPESDGTTYFTDKSKTILSPFPVAAYVQDNVNFLKVVNTTRDIDGTQVEKIYYGFVHGAAYISDGLTQIDWTPSEFYNSIWNDLYFGNFAVSNRANYIFNGDQYEVEDDLNGLFKTEENYAAGPIFQLLEPNYAVGEIGVEEQVSIAKDNIIRSEVRFVVIELIVDSSLATGLPGARFGFPSERGFIILPYCTSTGLLMSSVSFKESAMASALTTLNFSFSGPEVDAALQDLSNSAQWKSGHMTAGMFNTTDYFGINWTVDSRDANHNPTSISFGTNGMMFTFPSSANGTNSDIPYLYYIDANTPVAYNREQGDAKTLCNLSFGLDPSFSLQKMSMNIIEGYYADHGESPDLAKSFEGGYLPAKLSHYLAYNILSGDQLLGAFKIDETDYGVSNPLVYGLFSGPQDVLRRDLFISPRNQTGRALSSLAKKFVVNHPTGFTFANDAWATYSYLNQNSMQWQKNNIDVTQSITDQQNQFNNDQAHLAASNNTQMTKLQQSQNTDTTNLNQKWNIGTSLAQGALGGAAAGAAVGPVGALVGGITGLIGGGINAGIDYAKSQSLLGLSNSQMMATNNLSNSQQLGLANNSMRFGDKIAGITAKNQLAGLNAGWADVKLQPPTTISSSNAGEYDAMLNWMGVICITSLPSTQRLNELSYLFARYGYAGQVIGSPLNLMFTRSVMNYVEFETIKISRIVYGDVSTEQVSRIENTVLDALEAAFKRGVTIWHNLENMASETLVNNTIVRNNGGTII